MLAQSGRTSFAPPFHEIGQSLTFIVHKGLSPHHLVGQVGQVGQLWGVSPGGRLSASQCANGGAFLLAGDGNGHLDTCDRMMESLTSRQLAPTVRIKHAKGEKLTILSMNGAKGP